MALPGAPPGSRQAEHCLCLIDLQLRWWTVRIQTSWALQVQPRRKSYSHLQRTRALEIWEESVRKIWPGSSKFVFSLSRRRTIERTKRREIDRAEHLRYGKESPLLPCLNVRCVHETGSHSESEANGRLQLADRWRGCKPRKLI